MLIPKNKPDRYPDYLKALRDEPCIVTGARARPGDPVEAAHIGTAGRSIKSPDDEVLPILSSIHKEMHAMGEISTLRQMLPTYVLREALRAYAREMYQEWLNSSQ